MLVSLPDMDAAKLWMIEHQLGQRNLSDDQKYYWIGKHNELQKKLVGRPNGNGIKVTPFQRTREEVAAQHKVSEATVSRATQFARAMDTIADKIGDEARTEILDGEIAHLQADEFGHSVPPGFVRQREYYFRPELHAVILVRTDSGSLLRNHAEFASRARSLVNLFSGDG